MTFNIMESAWYNSFWVNFEHKQSHSILLSILKTYADSILFADFFLYTIHSFIYPFAYLLVIIILENIR